MAKTKKPTGMTIARKGNVFTVSWKIGDSDYADGQQFQYKISNQKKWHHLGKDANIGKKVIKQNFTFPVADYYPTTGKTTKATGVAFRVRGNRKSYKQKNKTIKPEWSDWTEKTYAIKVPINPTLSVSMDSENENVAYFAWTATSDDSSAMYTKVEWQTALSEDSKTPTYGASNFSTATSGTITMQESTATINNGKSHTRWVRIRALGIGGASNWVVAKHVYADPKAATNLKATGTPRSGAVDVIVDFNTSRPATNPIDSIKIEYLIAQPESGLSVPDEASWTTGASMAYANGKDKARFTIPSTIGDDKVLFVRINPVHDTNDNPSDPYIAYLGKLLPPSTPITTAGTGNVINVASTNASQVEDSFLAVTYHDMNDSDKSYIAGIIEHNDTSVNIAVPDDYDASSVKFGVKAIAGATYEQDKREDGSTCYVINSNSSVSMDTEKYRWMESDEVWTTATKRPTDVSVNQKGSAGTARVTWKWSQSNVSGVQIAWADHDDAWESTDEPETYEVSVLNSPSWNIAGLATGKVWYFRVRFYIEDDNETQYSPWSDIVSLNLTSDPTNPTLTLTNDLVLIDDEIKASWDYISTDGTPQAYAEVREVTISQGQAVYGDLIGSTDTGREITIIPSELGWVAGNTHYLAVRVVSESNRESEWSSYVPLTVVTPVTCTITSTSLVSESIDGRQVTSLKDMPLTVQVTGAGDDAVTSLVIERTDSYMLDRPDEGKTLDGYEGEAVYVYNQTGDDSIVIAIDDPSLIGRLDDGASYRLVATVSDSYGQKATATVEFEVHWTHQALMPLANATVDMENFIATITPIAPVGAIASDRCDIYRLSADKPVLIYPDAEFGKTYVDPYPALNEHGGHRVVFKTANGDYITADNQLAWIDLRELQNDYIESKKGIVDFEGGRIEFNYNLDVSHSWDKDFTETRYLGGSVQGDWNPAIGRTGSMSSVALRILDGDMMEAVRRLASFAGVCKVRTPDGTSISADVQVSESWKHDKGQQVAEYSLSFTRVDPEGYEGMTWEEYISGLAIMRSYALNDVLHVIETVDVGTQGGRTFAVNSDGDLIMTVQDDAAEGIDFTLNNGRLMVSYVD